MNHITLEKVGDSERIEITQAVLDAIKEGDSLLAEKVYFQYYHFLYKQADKFKSRFIPFDDALSIANLGYQKALNSFNPNAGVKFMTFMATVIMNELRMAYRHEKKKNGNNVSLESPLSIDEDGKELSLLDILEARSDDGRFEPERIALQQEFASEFKESLDRVLKRMNPKYRVVILAFLEGKTQREIRESTGFSPSYCSKLVTGFLNTLKKELIKEGLATEETFAGRKQKSVIYRRKGAGKVETLKDIEKPKELETLKEMKKPKELETLKEMKKPKELETLKEMKKPKELESKGEKDTSRLDFDTVLKLKRLCLEGKLKPSEIAQELGIPVTAVYYYYRAKGMGRRKYETAQMHRERVNQDFAEELIYLNHLNKEARLEEKEEKQSASIEGKQFDEVNMESSIGKIKQSSFLPVLSGEIRLEGSCQSTVDMADSLYNYLKGFNFPVNSEVEFSLSLIWKPGV
jgi:RNA polymerase sigma factor (sigma-70 family)